MDIALRLLLDGETTRFREEWQEQPHIWNFVRREVDDRKLKGRFILTSAAHPKERIGMHRSAGRFTVVEMQKMRWQKLGYAIGSASLALLLEGAPLTFRQAVDPSKTMAPASLNSITGGNVSYTRSDGINVISLASLGF